MKNSESGSSYKQLGILLVLIASILLVAPLCLMILDAMFNGYNNSFLGDLIAELEED